MTDTLSPLVHAAPDEPSRIFLSTQLVDEARHSVFFSRFFKEVVGIEGGLPEALMSLRDRTVDAFRVIFDTDLVEVTERVRMNPADYAAWVEGITVYHLVVEGMLAPTGQKYLLGLVREMGILPEFYTGFTAVARDESRHVNLGGRALISLTKRLRTVGLPSRACDEISKRGNLYYENAWNEYEDIHGEEHPRRFFDRLAPAAS